jgi:hypothetical protein
MAATIGVSTIYGFTATAGTHIQESTAESSCEVVTVRNASGTTVKALPKKMVTNTYTIRTAGHTALSQATAGAIGTSSARVVSVASSETNDGIGESTVTLKKFGNLS